jgi:hypothetical protein
LASGAPIRLDHVELAVEDRVLDVDQPDHPQLQGDLAGGLPDLGEHLLAQAHRRDHAGRVAGVHPGLLHVLHHPGDVAVPPVRERVHVDLDRVLEEAIEEKRVLLIGFDVGLQVGGERLRRVADLHRPTAEDVGGPDQQREADVLGDRHRLLGGEGGAVGRVLDLQAPQQRPEPPPVLGQVDRVNRGPQQRHPGLLEVLRQAQRRLAAELDDHALGSLDRGDREHVLDGQRLEVEAVGGVVVG